MRKDFINKKQTTEEIISKYITKDNELERALMCGASEDEIEQLEAQVRMEQRFVLDFLLCNDYGYDIKKIKGVNQWYKK